MDVRALAAAALALVAACEAETTNLDAGRPAPGPRVFRDASAPDSGCPEGTETVELSATRTHVSSSGVATEPLDLDGARISALVRTATPGAFDEYPGEHRGPGRAVIPCVPEGEYYLERKWSEDFADYEVTASRTVEQSIWLRGRPGTTQISPPSTRLSFDLDGLDPWRGDDELSFVSTDDVRTLTPALPTGATEARGVSGPSDPYGLIDAAQGDRLALFQMRQLRTSSNEPFRKIERLFEAAPFTMIEGSETIVSGTFSPPARTRSVSIDWRRRDLAAAYVTSTARGPADEYFLSVISLPDTPRLPTFLTGEVTVFSMSSTTASNDLSAVVPLALPFEDEQLIVVARAIFRDGTSAFTLHTQRYFPLGTSESIVVEPAIGPARNVRLNGLDSSSPRWALGEPLRIEWDRPAFGEPLEYSVVILGSPVGLPVVVVTTRGREIVVPRGRLAPGRSYRLQLTASERDGLSGSSSIVFTDYFSL
jgi:hypothetical protein